MQNNTSKESDIVTPAELAADYKTTKPTALSWYHKGLIPAVVADGRIIRFSRAEVSKALALRANNPDLAERARVHA
ncbi:MAG: hypothetical protein NTW21_16550 [Verrucomicrobia bacterium]|nr:hypothetical protein [Verrucomicrobiota bacterium]